MKCPKCKKEMERMEYSGWLKNLIGNKFDLVFVCHNCKIFVNEEYELFKTKK